MSAKIVGLTGGIGSGKSTVADFFISLGVEVYIADDEAKNILFTPEITKEIVCAFGEEALTDGIPDRKKLAGMVFNDAEKLSKLNAIIHPKVRKHFTEWAEMHSSQNFVIKEAAILFESGSYKECDKIILVTAPKELRIKRVMARDNVDEAKVLERMANQWDDEQKRVLSDYIIENVSLEATSVQVLKIYKELKNI